MKTIRELREELLLLPQDAPVQWHVYLPGTEVAKRYQQVNVYLPDPRLTQYGDMVNIGVELGDAIEHELAA